MGSENFDFRVFRFFGGFRTLCQLLHYNFQIVQMVLFGKEGAEMATKNLLGKTIHRRTLVALGMNVDLHIRVSEKDLGTSAFPNDFNDQLGMELAGLPPHVFDELVTILLRHITGLNQQAALKCIFCHQFPGDIAAYSAFVNTDFFQLLRHYMSKSFYGHVVFWVFYDSLL